MKKVIKKSRDVKTIIISILFFAFLLFAAFIYLHNLTVDVYGGDVGDLVTAAYFHGVPHAPGYPLFTFIGFLLSHLPLAMLTVSKIALISVISSVLTLFFLWKILKQLAFDPLVRMIAISLLAFSYLFWLYTELPEVFALNVMLSFAFLYSSIVFFKTVKYKYFLLTFFLFGLGLTNHQTIILLFPQFLLFLGLRRRDVARYKTRLLFVPLAFLLGILPYIYIPIAASQNPIINWDNASTVHNFIHLVLRQDYGTFSAGAFSQPIWDAKLVILKNFIMTLISCISFPAFGIGIIGLLFSLKRNRAISLGLLLSFLLTGPVFTIYAGFPVVNSFILGAAERFFILPFAIYVIFTAYGLWAIKLFFERVFSKKIYAVVLMSVFFLIPILLFKANYKKTDLSKTFLGTQFGKDYLRNLPKNALLITSGDTKSFNAWYVHFVLGFRPDIELVPFGNFGFTNKYFDDFIKTTAKKTGLEGEKLTQMSLKDMSRKRPVYSMDTINLNDQNFIWLPSGLTVKLIRKSEIPKVEEFRKMIRHDFNGIKIPDRDTLSLVERGLTLSEIPTHYSEAFYRIGNTFQQKYSDPDTALLYFQDALEIDPQYTKGYIGRSSVENMRHQCSKAEDDIEKAISFSPTENTYYQLWYLTALGCSKDKVKAQKIAGLYNTYFHSKISDDLKKIQ
jgi:hypothetical protein